MSKAKLQTISDEQAAAEFTLIPVIDAQAAPIIDEVDMYIAIVDGIGNGRGWISLGLYDSEQAAAWAVRYAAMTVKQARIARVLLPCKVTQ